jgi:AraC-like DNA-binding protein
MIRLALLAPVIEDLEEQETDCRPVLTSLSLKRKNVDDPDFWIPAAKLYALMEGFAEISGDPYFGVRSGEQLNPWQWPPTAQASQTSSLVGEFLLKFMTDSQKDVTSCTYILETTAERTTFQERRITDGGVFPRHNDGYTITYLLAILRGAVGEAWTGNKVLARVCDPSVIPPGYHGIRTARTDTFGASIVFPSQWLLLPVFANPGRNPAVGEGFIRTPMENIVDAFHYAVAPHLHEPKLDTKRVAELCGLTRRTLARKLHARGTSCYREVSQIRCDQAEQQLLKTNASIAQIASAVGYSDPVVFSRAFKRWTGMTPSQYRKKHRSSLAVHTSRD